MWVLVSTFVDIALNRRGPEDLPASGFLFAVVVLCNFLVGLLSVSISRPFFYALSAVGVSALLFLAFIAATLSLFGKLRRFYQTATAYAGADTLISLLYLPLLLWVEQYPPTQPPIAAAVMYLLLIIWSLQVFSHILSRSLEVSHWIAATMVIAYFLFSYSLSSVIFSPAT